MSISLLYGCCHVELSVRDLDEACGFLETALGATPVEQALADDLRALVPDGYGIEHLECGQATFQLNQPPGGDAAATGGRRPVHQRYLDDVGPYVTDLNFYVDDIGHARDVLTRLGAETLMEGRSTMARSLADYGPANTRPGGDARPFLYLGARSLVGFDLELMEPNFERFADQTAQVPCFVEPRPASAVPGLRLRRLDIAVPDLDAAYRNLVEIVTPGSRSNPYAVDAGSLARTFRITLGGIGLQYWAPTAASGPIARHLAGFGPGVVDIAFGAPDVRSVLERLPAEGAVAVAPAESLLGDEPPADRWQLASRALVGFDIVVERLDDHPFAAAR
jgi:catechol 2,3-dioxygenase-like lactoylglutathione lyase family enzyme